MTRSEPGSGPDIVVIEDEPNLRELTTDLMTDAGRTVHAFSTLEEGAAHLESHIPDLVLLDVRLPDGDGLVLLERLRSAGFTAPVVVMTAFGTVDRAIQALRLGASDFLVKPFDNARLLSAVEAALWRGNDIDEVALRAATVMETGVSREIIGATGGLREVVEVLPRIASTDANVLLTGESGTGKELIARAIHVSSPRMDGPFVAVNCAAIPQTLLESELFGFERGAFTGAFARKKGHIESAEGGTLLLDEIGDMSLEAQSRMLRVLQERELTRVGGRETIKVDVRVVAATHRDLRERVEQGLFRQDLLYRLDVIPIALPPLRARTADIPGLVEHFLHKHAKRYGADPIQPSEAELDRMLQHDWPGNVRELENLVERSVVLGRFSVGGLSPTGSSTEGRVETAETAADAAHPAGSAGQVATAEDAEAAPRTLKEVVAEAERRAVVAALRHARGNKAQAARLLGVSYKTLFNKINDHKIKEQLAID